MNTPLTPLTLGEKMNIRAMFQSLGFPDFESSILMRVVRLYHDHLANLDPTVMVDFTVAEDEFSFAIKSTKR